MIIPWLDARQATDVAIALADHFVSQTAPSTSPHQRKTQYSKIPGDPIRELLKRTESDTGSLTLNFYKRAKLANAFKWRLLEKGIESGMAGRVTQALVMHLSMSRLTSVQNRRAAAASQPPQDLVDEDLIAKANRLFSQGAYSEAVAAYQSYISQSPNSVAALTNLGAALCNLGRFREAEAPLRHAIAIRPKHADAYINLGAALRAQGKVEDAEKSLRRALKLNPNNFAARLSLGENLLTVARPDHARAQFKQALKLSPAHPAARLGLGQIATLEGHFADAEAIYRSVLDKDPNSTGALCGLIGLRRMTQSDAPWLTHSLQLIEQGVSPPEEANLRFAVGKFCDDTGDYRRAFEHYQRGNQILRANAVPYDNTYRAAFVDDLIRVYSPEAIATSGAGGSDSQRPVFVLGMPRSGTSLVEQIIASHPAAAGAGELDFWTAARVQHEDTVRHGLLPQNLRRKLASSYMQLLSTHSVDAQRIVDKTPTNADYVGMIWSVFPRARFIYVKRNPLDSCLSCYFQQFSTAMRFTMDLADLAKYFRQHHRLVSHWKAVLSAAILEVPYEALVSDQEYWSRQIIDFVGLPWNERCLAFHSTRRVVATASASQVRQPIYRSSMERWRHYENFLGPLLDLKDLAR